MEFIVEDGTGVPGAVSYVSVAESHSILFFDPYRFTGWETMEEAKKEKLLVAASRFLDRNFTFGGRRTHDAQEMQWPRTGVFDSESGFYVATMVIPKKVKEAVVELAVWFDSMGSTEPASDPGVQTIQSDDVSITFDLTAGTNTIPAVVSRILGTLGSYNSGEMRAIKIRRK